MTFIVWVLIIWNIWLAALCVFVVLIPAPYERDISLFVQTLRLALCGVFTLFAGQAILLWNVRHLL